MQNTCYTKRAENIRPFIFYAKGINTMKVAVIGSRHMQVQDLAPFLPPETDEIVSGGAKGIDTCARNFALEKGLKLTEFLPEYDKYGRGAPLKRNDQIIDYADTPKGIGVA